MSNFTVQYPKARSSTTTAKIPLVSIQLILSWIQTAVIRLITTLAGREKKSVRMATSTFHPIRILTGVVNDIAEFAIEITKFAIGIKS